MEETNWLEEMIERQALPEPLRKETTTAFCKRHNLTESNYYYHAQKPENQKKIIVCILNNVKKHAPEVLENLGERAKSDNKATEMYLKFILELAEKTDITSGGKPIVLPIEAINKYGQSTSITEEHTK